MDTQTQQTIEPPKKTNGLCIASFVVSLLFIFVCWIPFVGYGACVPLALGIFGIILAAKYKQAKGLGIAGVIISAFSLVIAILWSAAIPVIMDEMEKEIGRAHG